MATSGSNLDRAYQFQANVERYADSLHDRVRELYVNVIMLLFLNIVVGGNYSPGTPVDTGFARNSWVVGLNGIAPFRQPGALPSDVRARNEPIAIVSVSEGQAQILGVQLEDEVHLTSNAIYMAALEDGHSQQAPTGFIWLALHAGPQIVDYVAREMLS